MKIVIQKVMDHNRPLFMLFTSKKRKMRFQGVVDKG